MSAILSSYALEHPKVDLDVIVTDRIVNLVEEGFDLAVRAGELTDSSLISRKLINLGLAVVASPGYIDKHGVPAVPTDLRDHNCTVETDSPYGDLWTFNVGRKEQRIRYLPINDILASPPYCNATRSFVTILVEISASKAHNEP